MFFLVRHGEKGTKAIDENELSKVEKLYDCHLTKLGHQQATETGLYIKSKIEELINEGVVDPHCQIKLISSPYYRCLQTAKMIAACFENRIADNTIYVESAIEEWQSPHLKIDSTNRSMRFFDSHQPEKISEVFPKNFGRKFKTNKLFDYSKPGLLIAEFPESKDHIEERVFEYLRQIGDFFFHGKEDRFKTIYVLVAHGCHCDVIANQYKDDKFQSKYCCVHLAEILKCDENRKPNLNILVLGHYVYE